jgi:uncharacterized protein (TIGR00255 family)
MSVYSMTGYASAQHEARKDPAASTPTSSSADHSTFSSAPYTTPASPAPGARLGLEIRSVNGRFLDLTLRLPEELRATEPALRELVQGRLKRGKVELRAFIETGDGETLGDPSPRLLQRLGALQESVRTWLPTARELSVADVLRLASQQHESERRAQPQDWGTLAQNLAVQALDALVQAREREGARLATMLLGHIVQLRQLTTQAAPLVPQLVEQQRQRFLERWKEAMNLSEGSATPEAAQDRALTEATAYAIRIDVAEELTRLGAHLDEIERLLKKGGEMGKRLDFMIQELHREANTLGSKSATLELTRISVDMKVLIEQMREQVQNLE